MSMTAYYTLVSKCTQSETRGTRVGRSFRRSRRERGVRERAMTKGMMDPSHAHTSRRSTLRRLVARALTVVGARPSPPRTPRARA